MRMGSCLRCGLCCIGVGRFQYRIQSFILPDEPNYDTLIPIGIAQNDPPEPCEKLIFDIRTREAICLLHNASKPPICVRYPISNVDRLKDCGFYFEEDVHVSQ